MLNHRPAKERERSGRGEIFIVGSMPEENVTTVENRWERSQGRVDIGLRAVHRQQKCTPNVQEES